MAEHATLIRSYDRRQGSSFCKEEDRPRAAEKQKRKENKKDDDVESDGNDVDDDSDDANDHDNDGDNDVETRLRSRASNFHRRLRFEIVLTVGMITVSYIRFFNILRRSEFY